VSKDFLILTEGSRERSAF